MKKCNLKRAAKRFIKEIGGKISFEAVKRYLNSLGYEVVFYNSSKRGDALLEELNLSEYSKSKMAFTCLANTQKYVFINTASQNKLCSIIHESAHAIFEHMKKDKYIRNERLQELEAEAFTYAVLSHKRKIQFETLI